ncbi:MAG TPA: RNA polymerase sigma factor [Polyangia bacterium]|jgi:RNA polymerase sigma-70 factor (ECF subfamily)|nr:RNA polymerase sigma factor [Polyangia bacterium]
MNNDQICDALVAGKPWAGNALYACVESTIGAVLFRRLGYRDDEFDDLMQQAREKVFASVVSGQFARRCTLKIWAARITERIAVDAVRHRARERTFVDRSVSTNQLAAFPSVADTPERSIELHRRLGALRGALAAIKRERAEVLILHDLRGHNLIDIAKLKGVSVAAAQSRLFRGRREVAERIRKLRWEK